MPEKNHAEPLSASDAALKPLEKKRRAAGGGAKADDGCKNLTRVQLSLDQETIKVLSKIGRGELSIGVREASRRVVEAGDAGLFNKKRHLARGKAN